MGEKAMVCGEGREPQCSAGAGQVAQVKVGSNNKQFTNSHLEQASHERSGPKVL